MERLRQLVSRLEKEFWKKTTGYSDQVIDTYFENQTEWFARRRQRTEEIATKLADHQEKPSE